MSLSHVSTQFEPVFFIWFFYQHSDRKAATVDHTSWKNSVDYFSVLTCVPLMVPNLGFKAVGFVSLKIPFPHLSLERLFSSEFSVDCYVSYSPGQHLKVRKSLQYLGKVCRTLTVCPAFIGSRMKPTSVKCCTLNSYLQICWIKISYK